MAIAWMSEGKGFRLVPNELIWKEFVIRPRNRCKKNIELLTVKGIHFMHE
jgi:hypothetical protein